MNNRRTVLRRIASAAATAGAAGSALMLLVTILGLQLAGVSPAGAATAGTATVITPADGTAEGGQPLDAGGSATPFSLALPSGAACTGDSANSDYRVQGYMVPASVDPNSLTFDFGGPIPGGVGAAFRQPLFTSTSSAYVNAQTADNTVPGGPGPIVSIPAFSLGVFAPGNIPPGVYNLGIACTLGTASATQLDKFWNVQVTVAENPADQPAQVGWTVGGGSSTTTTTAGGSTTTTEGGSTTTTEGGSTTTTEGDGTTTTTTGDGTTTTTEAAFVAGGGVPSGTSVGGVTTSLPTTGSSTMALVGWSVLLVLCGRAAMLLARPPRVRPTKA